MRVQGVTIEQLREQLEGQVKDINRTVHLASDVDTQKVGRISLRIRNGNINNVNVKLAPYGLMLIAETKTIFIKSLSPNQPAPSGRPMAIDHSRDSVTVMVMSDKGEPLPGTTIVVKRTGKGTHTRKDGSVVLSPIRIGDSLSISHIGYRSLTTPVVYKGLQSVTLQTRPDQLGETVVVNYYSGKDRLQTGNVAIVNGNTIREQPVSNLPLALSGRIPGLLVTQTSGVQGAGVHMQVRGPSSIASGTDPFILIDRVPYSPNNASISNIASNNAAGSLSPFVLLNPADIENVVLLKDADATAIYGSRGANGVLLITTRMAHPHDPKWSLQASSGVSHATRVSTLLNTSQYAQMRREAVKNDALKEDSSNIPDLANWGTTRYTNFPRLLTGETGYRTNLNAAFSQAGTNTGYRVGIHYLHETNVFPGHVPNDQFSAQGHLNIHSCDNRLELEASAVYCKDWNHQYVSDLTPFQLLAPNVPSLLDNNGNPIFNSDGLSISNPYAAMLESYEAISENMLGNAFIHYAFSRHWAFRTNIGYDHINVDEDSRVPIAAQDPATVPTGSAYYATTNFRSWIVEPQLERMDTLGKLALNCLVGGSIQQQESTITTLSATGYTSDVVLGQPSGAAALAATDDLTQYKYAAVYGRVHVNYDNTYLLNLTARRDGSSRFGAGKQFGNFGAIGAAWIFTKLGFLQDRLPVLSFGKLRGSIGVTGNDQIGDYKYRTIWATTTTNPYQGVPGFYPTNVANPNLGWEKVLKNELALDLGFLHDRVYATAAWYHNQSSNMVIPFYLPLQTGFPTEIKNSGATMVNCGWEFTIRTKLVNTKKVDWDLSLHASIQNNRLTAFPNMVNTIYSPLLVIGQSLNVSKAYQYLGVDRTSGVFQFISKGPTLGDSDRRAVGNFDTHWYGGIASNLRVGRVTIDLFIEVRDQTGANYQALLYTRVPPGMWSGTALTNQTTGVLNRWQQLGDRAVYQQYTTNAASAAGKTIVNYYSSSAVLTDASFVRIKTLAVSWQLPDHCWKWMPDMSGRVFLAAENLLTFTHYQGTDPETQGLVLPPLRTVEAGLQINFK